MLADFSLPILIATWKFSDCEAFGLAWPDLLAKQMYPDDSTGAKSLPLALGLKLLK